MTALLPDLSSRLEARELMDSGSLSPAELDGALAFLEGCNRWLGGWSILRRRLEGWSPSWTPGRAVTLLDVGTGAGDLPRLAAAWGRRRGYDLRATGIDSDPSVVALARERGGGVELECADLFSFAAAGRRFDYVCASLFLHHVPGPALGRALSALDGLALEGVFIGDLLRSAGGYLAVSALTAVLGDRVTRHDGPVSIRRGFRVEELDAAAARAGLHHLKARREPFFRVSLSGEKS